MSLHAVAHVCIMYTSIGSFVTMKPSWQVRETTIVRILGVNGLFTQDESGYIRHVVQVRTETSMIQD